MGFIENHGAKIGENAGVWRTLSGELDGQIGKEEMMVDDDNVALHGSPVHFGDEAAVPFTAFLVNALFSAGIQPRP